MSTLVALCCATTGPAESRTTTVMPAGLFLAVPDAVASGTVRNKPASVTLVVRDSAGQVVGQQAGTSVDVQAALAAPGAYSWTVTGAGGVNWKMTLSYVSAG